MIKDITFNPNYLVNAGDVLFEYLEHYNMTAKDLSDETGIPESTLNNILDLEERVTNNIALKLEPIFGRPAKFWLRLDSIRG
jgi:addiction module HigA family antidote